MSEFQEPVYQTTTSTPRWVGLAVAILGAVSLAGLGVGWSALNEAKSTGQTTQASLKQTNDALNQRLQKSEDVNQQLQSDLKVVTDKLNVTQSDLDAARKQTKAVAATVQQEIDGSEVRCEFAIGDQGQRRRRLETERRRDWRQERTGRNEQQLADGAQRNGHADRAQP